LAAEVIDLDATEPVQDGQRWDLAAAQQQSEKLQEELQIEKRRSANLESQLDKSKSEPENAEPTDFAQLRLE
jgi:predicted  nucleic acid-binding Zn-ribbon protein